MKRKVWFMSSHLKAGGAERVFWLLSQYFDKSKFEVSLVLFDSTDPFFSTDLQDVNIIHLRTVKASKSFFKLVNLVRKEKPYAIFSNGSHHNILMAMVSIFAPIPNLIGREVNVPEAMAQLSDSKHKFWDKFVSTAYKRIHIGVCQSEEIRWSLSKRYRLPIGKLKIIPNPVVATSISRCQHFDNQKKLIVVARLAVEKGLFRLLEIVQKLPDEYTLSIAGEGPLKYKLIERIKQLRLESRVKLLGLVKNVQQLVSEHSLMVLTSYTEGFPNVVLESLSVGVPVVSFRVSGISALLKNDFNGYIIDQNDNQGFVEKVLKACHKEWDTEAIKHDVNERFGVLKVTKMYEDLLLPATKNVKKKPSIAEVWQD